MLLSYPLELRVLLYYMRDARCGVLYDCSLERGLTTAIVGSNKQCYHYCCASSTFAAKRELAGPKSTTKSRSEIKPRTPYGRKNEDPLPNPQPHARAPVKHTRAREMQYMDAKLYNKEFPVSGPR